MTLSKERLSVQYIDRTKNQVVVAIQFTGYNIKECINLAGKHMYLIYDHKDVEKRVYTVSTPTGERQIQINDFIVNYDGMYYPCKAEIFDSRYEPLYDSSDECGLLR